MGLGLAVPACIRVYCYSTDSYDIITYRGWTGTEQLNSCVPHCPPTRSADTPPINEGRVRFTAATQILMTKIIRGAHKKEELATVTALSFVFASRS